MNLISTSKGDSSVIYNTKGYLYPTQQKFYGSGGNVDWTREPDGIKILSVLN